MINLINWSPVIVSIVLGAYSVFMLVSMGCLLARAVRLDKGRKRASKALVPDGPWAEAIRCVSCNQGFKTLHHVFDKESFSADAKVPEGKAMLICSACGGVRWRKGIGRPIKGQTAWEWHGIPLTPSVGNVQTPVEAAPTEAARIAAELEADPELRKNVEQLLRKDEK